MDAAAFFDASFSLALCESAGVTSDAAMSSEFLTIRAPRPGFDEHDLIALVDDELLSRGVRPVAIHFYILDGERVGVARLGVESSVSETLATATEQLELAFAEDSRESASSRVPYVLVVSLSGADYEGITAALGALRAAGVAFSLGSLEGVPPPFDPARDQQAADIRNSTDATP